MTELSHPTKQNVLIASHETALARALSLMLQKSGYEVNSVANYHDALNMLGENRYDLVIVDLNSNDASELDFCHCLKRSYPETESILLTGGDDAERASLAIQVGAGDHISKPFSDEEVLLRVSRAMERCQLKRELVTLRQHVAMSYGFDNIVGISRQIEQARETARRVAPTEITVLITGASGTGKELFARTIHHHSERRQRPFVAVDLGAIDRTDMETALFGSKTETDDETGQAAKPSLIEQAHGGTLFLDEVSRLTPDMQAKLLRFLQDSGQPSGENGQLRKLDVRTIATCSRNLANMVTEGKFREDLYYRLNVIPLQLPTLRERSEDIEILTDYFLRHISAELGKPFLRISREAIDKLLTHPWPGNIRELENTLKRAAALSGRDRLEAPDITFVAGSNPPDRVIESGRKTLTIKGNLLEGNQKTLIIEALNDNNWNYTRTAAELGIGRTTLWRKIRKYDLKRELVSAGD